MTAHEFPATDANSPVALVTGGGRRVGQGIALALAQRGYRLALHANASLAAAEKTAKKLSAKGCAAIAVAADLRDQAATRAMIARVRDHFGQIDALVNNAAIWSAKPLEEVTPDDVRENFEINTLGTFVCCQQAGLVMVAQEQGGAIVNIGDWAIERPYRDHAAYFVSKGTIPTLTRTFAVELGLRNPRVRVNCVLPGPVLMPEGTSPGEQRQIVDATLVKRWGTVEELARAILFLLENSFVTGVCLPVDGGRSIYAPDAE
jgi:pteridine reductase